jgi:hypothetical protein
LLLTAHAGIVTARDSREQYVEVIRVDDDLTADLQGAKVAINDVLGSEAQMINDQQE